MKKFDIEQINKTRKEVEPEKRFSSLVFAAQEKGETYAYWFTNELGIKPDQPGFMIAKADQMYRYDSEGNTVKGDFKYKLVFKPEPNKEPLLTGIYDTGMERILNEGYDKESVEKLIKGSVTPPFDALYLLALQAIEETGRRQE